MSSLSPSTAVLHEEIHVEVNKALPVDAARFSSDHIPLAAASDAIEFFL